MISELYRSICGKIRKKFSSSGQKISCSHIILPLPFFSYQPMVKVSREFTVTYSTIEVCCIPQMILSIYWNSSPLYKYGNNYNTNHKGTKYDLHRSPYLGLNKIKSWQIIAFWHVASHLLKRTSRKTIMLPFCLTESQTAEQGHVGGPLTCVNAAWDDRSLSSRGRISVAPTNCCM